MRSEPLTPDEIEKLQVEQRMRLNLALTNIEAALADGRLLTNMLHRDLAQARASIIAALVPGSAQGLGLHPGDYTGHLMKLVDENICRTEGRHDFPDVNSTCTRCGTERTIEGGKTTFSYPVQAMLDRPMWSNPPQGVPIDPARLRFADEISKTEQDPNEA